MRGKTHLREKRATENEKIAKKALTKGIESILKSSDNGKIAAKKAVKDILLVPIFLELMPILGVIYAIFR